MTATTSLLHLGELAKRYLLSLPSPFIAVDEFLQSGIFSGRVEHCEEFLTKCCLAFLLHPDQFPSERTQVAFVVLRLAGPALHWAGSLAVKEEAVLHSLDLFLARFCQEFGPPNLWSSTNPQPVCQPPPPASSPETQPPPPPASSPETQPPPPPPASSPEAQAPGRPPEVASVSSPAQAPGRLPESATASRRLQTPGRPPESATASRRLQAPGRPPESATASRRLQAPGRPPESATASRRLQAPGRPPEVASVSSPAQAPGRPPCVTSSTLLQAPGRPPDTPDSDQLPGSAWPLGTGRSVGGKRGVFSALGSWPWRGGVLSQSVLFSPRHFALQAPLHSALPHLSINSQHLSPIAHLHIISHSTPYITQLLTSVSVRSCS
ncbi:formin-like protein 5 [Siniperca chuatsi]|uniref:formin-like protein 5 n=1 Tax=Siniperca chuatsi TaxID=119488 RepID=UPI001CE190F7|nr:formin-like protein 5 [Siniperca chuatsi]